MRNSDITIIGAGSYGTALAISLARNKHKVQLWGHNYSEIQQMQEMRVNKRFLPDIPFPETLAIEADLAKAVAMSRDLLIVTPSHVFSDILLKIKPYLLADARIAWATKGLEPTTGRLLQEVALEIVGDKIPLAVISGPTFAKELAAGLPTAVVVASNDEPFVMDLQQLLHSDRYFRVYSHSDMVGVQLGGAIKNVIAIGAGMSDGLGFGANARTALITRGLAEMCRLGEALGANTATFMGMAGLGDLVLTCTDNQSRNRRFGLMLGQGKTPQAALAEIGQVVEGLHNTKEVRLLAQRYKIEMPITEQIYQVLYDGHDLKEAAFALLGRSSKSEIDRFQWLP